MLDVVITGEVLEDIRPVVAGQVPVANSGHQVILISLKAKTASGLSGPWFSFMNRILLKTALVLLFILGSVSSDARCWSERSALSICQV